MLTFYITPQPQPRINYKGRFTARAKRYYQYCEDLKKEALINHYHVGECLNITFYLPMPKSWSQKKKALMDQQPHRQKPDLSNLVKAFEDALLKEDCQIHTYQEIDKMWGKTGMIIIH